MQCCGWIMPENKLTYLQFSIKSRTNGSSLKYTQNNFKLTILKQEEQANFKHTSNIHNYYSIWQISKMVITRSGETDILWNKKRNFVCWPSMNYLPAIISIYFFAIALIIKTWLLINPLNSSYYDFTWCTAFDACVFKDCCLFVHLFTLINLLLVNFFHNIFIFNRVRIYIVCSWLISSLSWVFVLSCLPTLGQICNDS